MKRLGPFPLILLAGMAAAEGPTTAEEDLATLGYISAAKAGAFAALPPTANGFPKDLLANMRMKLGGERPLPDTGAGPAHGAAESQGNGH